MLNILINNLVSNYSDVQGLHSSPYSLQRLGVSPCQGDKNAQMFRGSKFSETLRHFYLVYTL
jgi:hypothetical protein